MKNFTFLALLLISSISIYSNGTSDEVQYYPLDFDIDEDQMHRLAINDIDDIYMWLILDLEEFDLGSPIFSTLDYSSEGGILGYDKVRSYSKVIFVIFPSVDNQSNRQVYVFRFYDESGSNLVDFAKCGMVENPLTIDSMYELAKENIYSFGLAKTSP